MQKSNAVFANLKYLSIFTPLILLPFPPDRVCLRLYLKANYYRLINLKQNLPVFVSYKRILA